MGNGTGLTSLNLRENSNYQRDEIDSLKARLRILETQEWPFVNLLVIDAKGDLIVGTGPNTYANMAAGPDGSILVADSSSSFGLSWSSAGDPIIIGGSTHLTGAAG